MSPLISVVIPVWNRPEFLKISAGSVLNQTYKNFELIIVDDGSDDDTLKTAYELAYDPRVVVIEKEHSGATDTFNKGLMAIKGEAFCILGSDDMWLPNKLQKQVAVHKAIPKHILHTESYRIDVNGDPQKDIHASNVLKELGGTTTQHFVKRHLNRPYAAFYASSLFAPTSVIDKVGLFPETVGHDYHWLLRAVLVHNIPITLIPKHLIKNRTNPRSTTCEKRDYILKEAKWIWASVIKERNRKGIENEI